jgi:hypothetical protein
MNMCTAPHDGHSANQGRPFCAAGLSSVQDDLFRSSFVDVYSSPSLKSIPWHAVLGYNVVVFELCSIELKPIFASLQSGPCACRGKPALLTQVSEEHVQLLQES